LEITEIGRIKLNPAIMNYVNQKRGYIFSESLAKRSSELKREITEFGVVIWPVIVRKEDWMLVDGYCRYIVLKAINVRRIYAYVGVA